MKRLSGKRLRCAIYTRVSTEHGLEQDFNSLDAQREAAEAYIKSQAHEGWTLIRAGYDDGGFSGGSLDRPALQRLLADVLSGLVDVVVVYKVDRLTRSLTDFAKLVELFDGHQVSFVSVTQSFNTTSSMGRLTLNVLLSFAQFEREVTSERIRDKIAASKRRGLWVGGMVPLGYESRDKKLVVVDEEAERVRLIFRRYLELGSLDSLMRDLRERGVITKVRRLSNGSTIGGIPFTRGPLAYLLRNRFYVGKVVYRGEVCPAEHEPILARELFDAVRVKLTQQHQAFLRGRTGSAALLMGRIYDDRGNRMTPTHAQKAGRRYRYYVSCALNQGRPEEVGSVPRIAAVAIEPLVISALREHHRDQDGDDERALIERSLEGVTVGARAIEIRLAQPDAEPSEEAAGSDAAPPTHAAVISVPWTPTPLRRARDIILPAPQNAADRRPIRAETRATLLRAIASGRRWLEELASGTVAGPAAIATREGCSPRRVTMLISLAFLAPDLVKAAVDGRLPRGVGLARLVDPPLAWAEQWRMLGLAQQSSPKSP
jgi:site-specific DNA recombinase